MSRISDSYRDNPYIRDTNGTVFTFLFEESIKQFYGNQKELQYIHGLISYNIYNKNSDLFQYINDHYLEDLKKKKIFFVFDASVEGYSPILQIPLFDMLYWNCQKYQVDPKQIIYVSANLKDEDNILSYCKKQDVIPINVFSFPSFEMAINEREDFFKRMSKIKKTVNKNYNGKYFSSLSRRNRQYRTSATFLLCQDPIKERALISHDKFYESLEISKWKSSHGLDDFPDEVVKQWIESLPLIVDRADFEINWALDQTSKKIHDQTIFQIVNETETNDYNGTSLFLSEKTFSPIGQYQPFVIYGQPGCNHELKKIGYHLYNDWFDLSFDFEPDHILRYKKLLNSVKEACKELDKMNKNQQIEWRFKNKKLLEHNFYTMCNQKYTKDKLALFIKKIKNDQSPH